MENKYSELYQKSYDLRKVFLKMFGEIGYGHLTTAFSETEILISLFYEIMRFEPDCPENRDRFVLSKGHGAGMLYPIFVDKGFFTYDHVMEMISLGGDDSPLQEFFYPAFEFYGGSLGLGLGLAAGLALGDKFSRNDKITYCLVGDAECYEGAIWEAILFAGHNRLNNLVVIVDRNYLGCSDFTENMCELEPFEEKWKSFNWDTCKVDGHSYYDLVSVLEDVRTRRSSKPKCIIANTQKGKGLGYLSNIPLNHGYMPKGVKLEEAHFKLERLGDQQ